jgi:hypothetical protein
MGNRSWRAATALAAVLVAPLLAAVAAAGPATAVGDPMAGAPVVGECHFYEAEERFVPTEPSEPVDCTGKHTAAVIAVAVVPNGMDLRDDSDVALARFASRTCGPALADTLDVSHNRAHLVRYTYSWFVPTATQLEQGARWIRCDLNELDGRKLDKLPANGLYVDGFVQSWNRRCLSSRLLVVSCLRPHTWTARGLVTVPDGRWSVVAQDARARSRCRGTLQRKDRRYLWVRVSEFSWSVGERHVVCFGAE